MEAPRPLRSWLVVHAALHVAAGVPLLVRPALLLHALGWTHVGPVAPRLVGAAALAIGATSLFALDAPPEILRARVRLNLVWSFVAAAALFIYIGAGAPPATWAFLSAFIVLSGVWFNNAIRFRQLDRAGTLEDDSTDADEGPSETDE